MKKLGLIMLIVSMLLATPCFSQEIEPQGFLTSNGTFWRTVCDKDEVKCIFHDYVGFSGNNIYFAQTTPHFGKCSHALVINLGLISFYWSNCFQYDEISTYISGFVISMLGIGINKREDRWREMYSETTTDMIIKIDSYWKPTPTFVEIWPTTGEQSSELTRVTIVCENTSFEAGVNEIAFSPPDGIMVSDIKVMGNYIIEFDMDISVDTPVGFKSVTVIWDEGKQVTTGNNVFWVRRASN